MISIYDYLLVKTEKTRIEFLMGRIRYYFSLAEKGRISPARAIGVIDRFWEEIERQAQSKAV